MPGIHWTYYPRVAMSAQATAWLDIQQKLLRAPKTIDAYARGLDDFLRVCTQHNINVVSATRSDIAVYVDEMAHRPRRRRAHDQDAVSSGGGLANKTMQQRLTAVRLFYDFLIECGDRETNPVGRGRYTPRSGFFGLRARHLLPHFEQTPWIPNDDQWIAFLERVRQDTSLRNQLMVYLAYDGALRRSELVALTLADIDFPRQQITIRSETAKNRSGRIVWYGDRTSDVLCAYVRHRHTLPGAQTSGRIFLSESHRNPGHPLTVEMWNKIVQRLARDAGLPRFSTHTFRHLRLTDLARSQLDLHEIAMYAGHRNLKTTHQYIRWSSTELIERIRQATARFDARGRHLRERGRLPSVVTTVEERQ